MIHTSCNKSAPVSEERARIDGTESGIVKSADSRKAIPAAKIIGSVIKFGEGDASQHYTVSGWSRPEERFTRTEGKVAKLLLPIRANPGPLIFRLKAQGMTNPPEVPFQPVEVFANGKKVADWKVDDIRDYTAEIPADLTTHGGRLLIELRTPKAIPPEASERDTTKTPVALYCYELELKRP
jgi:hypothetical protein